MALCAAWPSLPFINATTDGSATLHKKHTVRLGGAPIEITIKLRLCGAPLRCKGLSYVAVGTYKQFCVGLGEDSGFVALAFAQTHTFHVFFRMTFATVALALLHALLVFPALLAWFGPSEKEE